MRLGCKEERERERHGSAVTVAHLLLRRGAEHGQRQQRFRGCESALLAVLWSEWSGVEWSGGREGVWRDGEARVAFYGRARARRGRCAGMGLGSGRACHWRGAGAGTA